MAADGRRGKLVAALAGLVFAGISGYLAVVFGVTIGYFIAYAGGPPEVIYWLSGLGIAGAGVGGFGVRRAVLAWAARAEPDPEREPTPRRARLQAPWTMLQVLCVAVPVAVLVFGVAPVVWDFRQASRRAKAEYAVADAAIAARSLTPATYARLSPIVRRRAAEHLRDRASVDPSGLTDGEVLTAVDVDSSVRVPATVLRGEVARRQLFAGLFAEDRPRNPLFQLLTGGRPGPRSLPGQVPPLTGLGAADVDAVCAAAHDEPARLAARDRVAAACPPPGRPPPKDAPARDFLGEVQALDSSDE